MNGFTLAPSTQIKMEIMEAVWEKAPKFTFKHITFFHNIVTEHEKRLRWRVPVQR